eukprot:scaffold16790_cov101-Isochrysis_galbana.AAC.2
MREAAPGAKLAATPVRKFPAGLGCRPGRLPMLLVGVGGQRLGSVILEQRCPNALLLAHLGHQHCKPAPRARRSQQLGRPDQLLVDLDDIGAHAGVQGHGVGAVLAVDGGHHVTGTHEDGARLLLAANLVSHQVLCVVVPKADRCDARPARCQKRVRRCQREQAQAVGVDVQGLVIRRGVRGKISLHHRRVDGPAVCTQNWHRRGANIAGRLVVGHRL